MPADAALDDVVPRLLAAKDDAQTLVQEYHRLVETLVSREVWSPGADLRRRVPWRRGREARLEYPQVFRRTGVYLWGFKKTSLYVGITRRSFSKRFSRYIWHEQSQCNLAQTYETELRDRGLEGFPVEVMTWYKPYGGSVRLRGAVAFARHGIKHIWFALLPHDSPIEITACEKLVVPVAQQYNTSNGFPELLNVSLL